MYVPLSGGDTHTHTALASVSPLPLFFRVIPSVTLRQLHAPCMRLGKANHKRSKKEGQGKGKKEEEKSAAVFDQKFHFKSSTLLEQAILTYIQCNKQKKNTQKLNTTTGVLCS